MITATSKEHSTVKVLVINKGETSGTPWLIVIPSGISAFYYVAIAQHAQDAMDIYADSKHGMFTKMDEPPDEHCYTQLGNCGDWHDLMYMTRDCLVPCTVNYFAKKDSV